MSGEAPPRAVVRAGTHARVDPTVEIVFDGGWVTFRNFRGTKRRLRIGSGKREIAVLNRSPSYGSFGGDVVFTNAANRGVIQIRDWGVPHAKLAHAARTHGVVVDESVVRYKRSKRPIRGWWWTPRLWNLRPHGQLYLRAAIIYALPSFVLAAGIWTLGVGFAVVGVICVVTALKLGIDKVRFDRYVAKHDIATDFECDA